MSKPPKLTQIDLDTFHKAAKGTKPLSGIKQRIRKSAPKPPPRVQVTPEINELDQMLNESAYLKPVTKDQSIQFHQPGIPNKTLRKLRKGQYNTDAILDLHGMTVETAEKSVAAFFKRCIQEELRVVLIIHGKGHHAQLPVLKNKLNYWLRNISLVLAFCTADPFHGAQGAVYVLLKHCKEESLA